MLYQEKFEPIANIGFSLQFYGGQRNYLNRQGGEYGHYEVVNIKPLPEYYLNPIQNNNASPVISSLAPSQTAVYNGADLQLDKNQIGQFRYSVLTAGLSVNLQFGKGSPVVYRTANENGGADSLLASTLYNMTEFYVFYNKFPYLYLQNTGSTTLTSALIVFSGFIYDVEFVKGTTDKMVIIPMLFEGSK